MSALAARRAAAAASSTASPAPDIHRITKNPESSSSKTKSRKSPAQLSRRISPSAPASSDSEDDRPSESSTKRRRVEKTITPIQDSKRPQRYFAPSSPVPAPKRNFSPSAPAFEEDDSSDGSSILDGAEGSDESEGDLAGMEVDEGRVEWSTLSTPRTTPGPSRLREPVSQSKTATDRIVSRFAPAEGVNFLRISAEDLQIAGLDDVAGDGVLISLATDENLMIAGTYTLTPLQNSISLLSTTLHSTSRPSSHPVFAPTSHPIPIIEPYRQTNNSPNLLSKLSPPKTFIRDDSRSVFLIREHTCGLDGLRGGAVPGFNHVFPAEDRWGLRNVNPVIGSFPVPVYPHITPTSWSLALDSLATSRETDDLDAQTPWIGLVKGPKRSGKSTFGRTLLNWLLETHERVAWLECDLGQGEFNAGGLVGSWIIERPILGPPFAHPLTPHRAHFLGTYTPLSCPNEYLAAVQDLVDHFKYEIQFPLSPDQSGGKNTGVVPLLVNTQGWVKGLGEDLLGSIETMVAPTHLFSFIHTATEGETPGWTTSPPPPSHDYSSGIAGDTRVFHLDSPPASPLQARYTAADMRILSMITYFHARLTNTPIPQPTWDFSLPLAAMPPYQVDLSPNGAIKEVYLIGEGSDGILPDDLELFLNGSIVALAQNSSAEENVVYVQGRPLPSHEDMTVLGLGLIRGVQKVEEGYTLQLLTPLPRSSLGKINAMIKNGAMEIPLCGLLDWRNSNEETLFGVEWDRAPFVDRGENAGVGGERRRFRRNIMRKGM